MEADGLEAVLPRGVVLRDLEVHADPRGGLAEIYRQEWGLGEPAVQWNLVRTAPASLRGVHVHPRHADYLIVVSGVLRLGLHDVRPGSATFGLSAMVELDGDEPRLACVPPGVAHGFYFPAAATYVYGLSRGWSMAEELGCRWDDPELGFDWGASDPLLSERDAAAGGYAGMAASFAAHRS